MDFSELLRLAAEGKQIVPSESPLSDEEREERLRQRQFALDSAMQAGPTMGTVKNFGGVMKLIDGGKGKPLPTGRLKEAEFISPDLDKLQQSDQVLKETIQRSINKPDSIPSKKMSAEEFENIMKLFGGK